MLTVVRLDFTQAVRGPVLCLAFPAEASQKFLSAVPCPVRPGDADRQLSFKAGMVQCGRQLESTLSVDTD
jgi:hypothetical protein